MSYLRAGWAVETSARTEGAPIRNGKHRTAHWTGSRSRGGARRALLGVKLITAAERRGLECGYNYHSDTTVTCCCLFTDKIHPVMSYCGRSYHMSVSHSNKSKHEDWKVKYSAVVE